MCHRTAVTECLVIRNGDDFIVNLCIQGFRYEACADALNFMRAALALRQHGRGFGLNCNDLDIGILFLQIFARARKRTARADACDKNIDLAIGITVNFRSCCLVVRLGIRRVDKLPRNKAVFDFFGEFIRLRNRARHALCAVGQYQFRTVRFHQLSAFYAHRFGHGDNDFIPADSRHRAKTDACIARSRLNNRAVRL